MHAQLCVRQAASTLRVHEAQSPQWSELLNGLHGLQAQLQWMRRPTCSLARPSRRTFITSAPATATDSGCAVALALLAALQHTTPCKRSIMIPSAAADTLSGTILPYLPRQISGAADWRLGERDHELLELMHDVGMTAARLHRPLRPRLLMADVLGTVRAPFLICSVTHLSSSSSSASCCHQQSSVTELLATVDTLSRAYRGWQSSKQAPDGAEQQTDPELICTENEAMWTSNAIPHTSFTATRPLRGHSHAGNLHLICSIWS